MLFSVSASPGRDAASVFSASSDCDLSSLFRILAMPACEPERRLAEQFLGRPLDRARGLSATP